MNCAQAWLPSARLKAATRPVDVNTARPPPTATELTLSASCCHCRSPVAASSAVTAPLFQVTTVESLTSRSLAEFPGSVSAVVHRRSCGAARRYASTAFAHSEITAVPVNATTPAPQDDARGTLHTRSPEETS